jgi:hypothetical protein
MLFPPFWNCKYSRHAAIHTHSSRSVIQKPSLLYDSGNFNTGQVQRADPRSLERMTKTRIVMEQKKCKVAQTPNFGSGCMPMIQVSTFGCLTIESFCLDSHPVYPGQRPRHQIETRLVFIYRIIRAR